MNLLVHLARALKLYEAWCRANPPRMPVELSRLADVLAASGGLPRTTLAPVEDPGDGAPVHDALDYRAAADRLSVSDRTVRRLVKRGDLPAVDIGGCRRIRTTDLAAYVDGLTPEGDPDAQ